MLPGQAAENNTSPATATTGTTLYGVFGFGEQIVYISDRGVRIKYPVAGLNIICQKPSYDLVWFNPMSKKIMKETLLQYRARQSMQPREVSFAQLPKTEVTFAGVRANKFTVFGGNAKTSFNLPKLSEHGVTTVQFSNYFIAKDIAVAPPLLIFLDTFYGMPNFGGAPLACTRTNSDRSVATDFRTSKVERGPLPKDAFVVPSGYSTVNTQMEVAAGPGYKEQLDDLARGMGIGDPLGTPDKPAHR